MAQKKGEQDPAEKEKLQALRHTTEHVLTQALQRLFPGIKMALGPAIEDGFYCDFDAGEYKISEEDFPQLEAEMKKIIQQNLPLRQEKVSLKRARQLFADNPYKQELLDEIAQEGSEVTLYWTGEEFVDLCQGPHLSSTGEIKAFKLLSVAGAYWRGEEKNKMLTRIYGTAFFDPAELEAYLQQREESKNRDHRRLGKKLNLFTFSPLVGKGLPLWTPRGAIIYQELENFVREEETKRGYLHVRTPVLAKTDLYRTSGHYPYYKESMYPPMQYDEDEIILRPMTCPHHFVLYMDQIRSYRELPLRLAELAQLFRYEKSGELTGLIRVRSFCLADSHIFCRRQQASEEIKGVLDLINFMTQTLGLKMGRDYWFRLSLSDPENSEKYYPAPEQWAESEKILTAVLEELELPFNKARGEAAFYGPKIDIQMRNANGKEDTAFTVQYDFCLPQRFNLTYINEKGQKEQPVVIHRSSIGCLERTIAFLIEHYRGAFPVWLTPVQVKILPVSQNFNDYAEKVQQFLRQSQIRTALDDRNETLNAKIRQGQEEKIPYLLIVGAQEAKEETVNVRWRDNARQKLFSLAEFRDYVRNKIESKSLEL